MKTIAVVNQKGGAGKTTTAVQLCAALGLRGHSVLGIDLDPQANFTATSTVASGGVAEDAETMHDVLLGRALISDVVVESAWGKVAPASLSHKLLATVGSILADDPGKTYRLREAIESARDDVDLDYDFIVIDTPPSRDVLSYNALVAADGVVVPSNAEEYSINGIKDIVDSIDLTRRYGNPRLEILGIVLTQVRQNLILHRDMTKAARTMADAVSTVLFEPSIRQSCVVGESQAVGQSVFDYAPGAGVTADYDKLCTSVLDRLKEVG